MSVVSFNRFQLGPRFYELEFKRSVAMRRLALQHFPLNLSEVSEDIVDAVKDTVRETIKYSTELSFEVRKILTNIKSIESMESPTRILQVQGLLEGLEQTMQNLIRYGWLIESEWLTYVKPIALTIKTQRRNINNDVFPKKYLRELDTWHMSLSKIIARVRKRSREARYGQRSPLSEDVESWETKINGAPLNPLNWSTEYVLEKAKSGHQKKRLPDTWLDAVPQIINTEPGHPVYARATDIRRRTPLHYAARVASDLPWLRHLHEQSVQKPLPHANACCQPLLAVLDVDGDSPLTIAAKSGNVGAVKYIIEDSGISTAAMHPGYATMVAYSEGKYDCLQLLIGNLLAFPEKIALTLRMSMFYGFNKLVSMLCAALENADTQTSNCLKASLDHSVQHMGGCSILHLAALNGHENMIKSALYQKIFNISASIAYSKDEAGLSPLDIANYFGYRNCANELLAFFAKFGMPVHNGMEAEDKSLHVQPFGLDIKNLRAPKNACSVFVTLGSNDVRRCAKMPSISIDVTALQRTSDKLGMPRSTRLLLRVSSKQSKVVNSSSGGKGFVTDVMSLLETSDLSTPVWQPPVHFYTESPEKFVLQMDLIATVDYVLAPYSDKQKILAQATLMLPKTELLGANPQTPGESIPLCFSSSNYMQAIFLSTATGGIVGEVNVEILTATPYKHKCYNIPSVESSKIGRTHQKANAALHSDASMLDKGISVKNKLRCAVKHREFESSQLFEPGKTPIYGHRGSGLNCAYSKRPGRLQLGENTVLSMEHAFYNGAAAVELDVQLTQDLVPVIYHNWIVTETGLNTPVNSLTLKQFLALNPRNHLMSHSRSKDDLDVKPVGLDTQASSSKTNSKETVQGPFATLDDLFNELPKGAGFDIEIKYPLRDKADRVGMATSFEVNLFLDRILDVIYKHVCNPSLPKSQRSKGYRPIVLTSFHPDICLLLAHKVGQDFPIMLLTNSGRSNMADKRCKSMDAAVRLSKWAGLAGIVTHVDPVLQSPRIVSLARRHKLLVATYGAPNFYPENVKLQKSYHVDAVITDDTRAAVAAIKDKQH
ncbi:Glycerophosphocholine phosphodiesterase [Coemansia sp. RSA 988]|nr:Glycerophosphocholine phosphodiesterase [Coemansia sp. RSA 988]